VHQGLNFHIRPGARVGISGMTGAGKTTLLNLLMRFYDPTTGAVLLDGADLRELKLADLRNQFGLVLQDAVLFSASIAENIAYARPGATQEEIERAATAANAHEFISSLPDGYNTLVGERGMRLSGGERQRISLARAFLKDAPILLLDEPTAHLDLQYQVSLLELVHELAHKDHLAMLIALHDLNLAAHYADRVALMVAGKIKAMGTPREVLQPEAIQEAYCLPVQVIKHPFLDVPLVLPDKKD
jgi:ABC-type multidrug transport system fused ATPase/permease subunit